MDDLLNVVINSLGNLTALDIVLLLSNGFLLIFSTHILKKFIKEKQEESVLAHRSRMFKAINFLIFAFILCDDLFVPVARHSWLTKLIAVPLVIYIVYLIFYLVEYLIKKRFGSTREINGKTVMSETYNSRILTILASIFLSIFCLIATIQILGFENMLKAGGVVGFIGVMLALTQRAWAPDIISGLIILNNDQFDDGDIIQFYDYKLFVGMVFKVKLFYTEVLNLTNNHRIMLRNSKLRDLTIHNLSKFASARGLHEELRFKIGYDVPVEKIRKMFKQAYACACKNSRIAVDAKYPPEIRARSAGDFAVEWSFFYFTKDIRNILRTRQLMMITIIQQAAESKISLATPVLYSRDKPNHEVWERIKKHIDRPRPATS